VLALAWVISDPRVTAVLVGPRDPSQLDAPVAALELALTADERLELATLFERV
jgi:aryl-alcohol dehydrogenase-like predicted oxidoreductase